MSKIDWSKPRRHTQDPARIQRDALPPEPVKIQPKRRPWLPSFAYRKMIAIKHQERERNEMLAEKNRQIKRIEAMQVNDNSGPGQKQAKREAKLRSIRNAEKSKANKKLCERGRENSPLSE